MNQGVLKIRDVKKGKEYKVAFENAKGRQVELVIQQQNRCFDEQAVQDGDLVEFELQNGFPVNCKVPGKEAAPVVKQKSVPVTKGNDWGYDNRVRGSAPARTGRIFGAHCNAVAPYNFVPFDASAVIPAFDDEKGIWSGKIVCKLQALTPLLVAGERDKTDENVSGECRFMQVNGQNVIPGTSIKGMLRSLIQIMSFSKMLPVSKKPLFWRRVNRPDYVNLFSAEQVLGGYLRKNGAEYELMPVQVTPVKKGEPKPADCEIVETGGFYNPKTNTRSPDYAFAKPSANVKSIDLNPDIVSDFWRQLTPNQEGRWSADKRNDRMAQYPGLPVFYRLDENGQIAALGFCRYFRLAYKYSPYQLAYQADEKVVTPDFAEKLFGSASPQSSFKGRIAVEPAFISGKLHRENGIEVVLGGPKPTCLPLYIGQKPANVKTMSGGGKNDPSSMLSYNDMDAKLRGYKLYWHHNVDEKFFPGKATANATGKNAKVKTRLFPLAAGAEATITIYADRLTDTELGALLEAIELLPGHAHKLGMGKSLGFGSVRLGIEDAQIVDIRKTHSSLADRLTGATACLGREKMQSLRQHFRLRILEAVTKLKPDWKNLRDYEDLPPIAALRIMLDYEHRPTPEQVRVMTLKSIPGEPWTEEVNFSINAILPNPAEVVRNKAARSG